MHIQARSPSKKNDYKHKHKYRFEAIHSERKQASNEHAYIHEPIDSVYSSELPKSIHHPPEPLMIVHLPFVQRKQGSSICDNDSLEVVIHDTISYFSLVPCCQDCIRKTFVSYALDREKEMG